MWPFTRKPEPVHSRWERFAGTAVVAIGLPRCGKTYTCTQLMVSGVIRTGLGALVQDPAGTAVATLESIKLGLSKAGHEDKAQLIHDVVKVYPGRFANDMLEHVDSLVGDGTNAAKDWRGFLLFDDAITIRQVNPGFYESVFPLMGNAGFLAYVTAHHDKAIPPAARQCVRSYLLWKTAVAMVIDGVEVDSALLTPPKSDTVSVFDASDFSHSTFDLREPPPLSLTLPAALTTVSPIKPLYLDRGSRAKSRGK